MNDKYTSVEEQVSYGLNSIDPDRKIEVSARDLMFVFKSLQEFVSFFHQPMHYPTLEHVEKFLGDQESGAFHLLHECVYEKLRDIWPSDIAGQLQDGDFDHPKPPYFYQPGDKLFKPDQNA